MKPYKQTIFGNGSDGTEPGNCFSTCIASILELPPEEVPNFVASGDSWWEDVQDFLRPYGYSMVLMDINHERNYFFHTGYAIAGGPGPRGHRHCVVYKFGEPVMDPHPDNTFLDEIDRYYFFVALDPKVGIAEVEQTWYDKDLDGWYRYQEIFGTECCIALEARPSYCDRGNFIAKIEAWGDLGMSLDHQDGWPRYYFDEERAKLEIEAWLKKRGHL